MIAPLLNNPPFRSDQVRSLAMVGLAAGTIPKQYTDVYGPIPIDGADIDPKIIEVGRNFFDMNEPNLNAIAQDGRYFLTNSSKRYDVIAVDAYRPPYIPFHLTTREFFQQVFDHLSEQGVMAINVGRSRTDFALVDVLCHTAHSVFPNVYVIDAPDYGSELGNSLVVATRQPTRPDNLAANLKLIEHPLLREVATAALPTLRPCAGQEESLVFTDDRAPVEQVIHGLIVRYVLGR